ncbi:3TM-type holin [Pseudovibrio exalbescens]|uniref:3TM-type holin n=1 Tax=Pseudovibrio exalbescens TaxID=197461 RepID=UPI002365F05B|nr:3TM-type holin [Pseudovibrio exalbescens]MDD7908545.1 3TM-type holin [Pseudovibrio exalbescens]
MSVLVSIAIKVLSSLGGKTVDTVLAHLERKADTQTDRQRIKAQITIEQIRAEIAAQQSARDIVLAEQGWWLTAMIRPAFAWPLIAWWFAVILDSIFKFSWSVAALPSPLDEWAGWIIAAYFMARPLEKLGRGYLHSRFGRNGR